MTDAPAPELSLHDREPEVGFSRPPRKSVAFLEDGEITYPTDPVMTKPQPTVPRRIIRLRVPRRAPTPIPNFAPTVDADEERRAKIATEVIAETVDGVVADCAKGADTAFVWNKQPFDSGNSAHQPANSKSDPRDSRARIVVRREGGRIILHITFAHRQSSVLPGDADETGTHCESQQSEQKYATCPVDVNMSVSNASPSLPPIDEAVMTEEFEDSGSTLINSSGSLTPSFSEMSSPGKSPTSPVDGGGSGRFVPCHEVDNNKDGGDSSNQNNNGNNNNEEDGVDNKVSWT
jgi:hypothetical protein